MSEIEQAAHRYADRKRATYVAKFKRPVKNQAADGVYVHAYTMFMRRGVIA